MFEAQIMSGDRPTDMSHRVICSDRLDSNRQELSSHRTCGLSQEQMNDQTHEGAHSMMSVLTINPIEGLLVRL